MARSKVLVKRGFKKACFALSRSCFFVGCLPKRTVVLLLWIFAHLVRESSCTNGYVVYIVQDFRSSTLGYFLNWKDMQNHALVDRYNLASPYLSAYSKHAPLEILSKNWSINCSLPDLTMLWVQGLWDSNVPDPSPGRILRLPARGTWIIHFNLAAL